MSFFSLGNGLIISIFYKFRSVFDQSNEVCKQRYQKPTFNEDQTYLDRLQKSNITHFNAKQKSAFRQISNWRNAFARQEDESEHYVVPFHMLLKICTELPREMQGKDFFKS